MFKNFLSLLLITTPMLFSTTASAMTGGKSFIEINGFLGKAFLTPDGLNAKINDYNALANPKISTISSFTVFGGEFIAALGEHWQIGPRYTTTYATSGKGTYLGSELEVGTIVTDISAIAKYRWNFPRFSFNVGGGIGVPTMYSVKVNANIAGGDYIGDRRLVYRFFGGARLNLGFVALFVEGGYQLMSAPAFTRSDNSSQLTSTKGTVGGNYNSPYLVGGLGIQF